MHAVGRGAFGRDWARKSCIGFYQSSRLRQQQWLSQGWDAQVPYGSVAHVNGEHSCNTSTLLALAKFGLIFQSADGLCSATAEGKKLSPGYVEPASEDA